MLIKSLILELSLLQRYLGILTTHFLSTAYFRGRENTEFSRAVTCIHTHPVTLLELRGAHAGAGGTRWSRGKHRPMHRIHFAFHIPAVVPLPAAGCPWAESTTAVSLPSPWLPLDLLPPAPATSVSCLCTSSPK